MKIAYVVLTCEKFFSTRVPLQRKTSLKDIKDIDIFYIGHKMDTEKRLFSWDAPDDYNSLPYKLHSFFANMKLNYDWYMIIDDDTYVVTERLQRFLSSFNPTQEISFGKILDHVKDSTWGLYLSGGAGTVLSHSLYEKLCRYVIDTPFLETIWHYCADITLCMWIKHLGFHMIDNYGFHDEFPEKIHNGFHNNNQLKNAITFHNVRTAEDFELIYNRTNLINITFTSCLYNIPSKFDISVYKKWMQRMITNCFLFNLVIYTNDELYEYIMSLVEGKENIKVIVKPIETFYNYKFIEHFKKNILNMLWSEKVHFVNQTVDMRYFSTDFYGWIDIGYFREDYLEDSTILRNWPNHLKINSLDTLKIYYACVNNDENYVRMIENLIKNNQRLPDDQVSIGGGFFILHYKKIKWWTETYDKKLSFYFENNFNVKDDQIIIADCIFQSENQNEFILGKEDTKQYDNWFMFTRLLL